MPLVFALLLASTLAAPRSPAAFALRASAPKERLALQRSTRQTRALRSLALPKAARLILSVAVAPTAVTVVFEWATGHTPANWIRFAAGIPIGVAVAWLVRSAAENQVN